MKTYIGKISHGFNFLGYYFDNNKLPPSQESIRRLKERAFALYEQVSTTYRRHKKRLRRYLAQWQHWVFLGLISIKGFLSDVETHLPSLLHVKGMGAMKSHGLID